MNMPDICWRRGGTWGDAFDVCTGFQRVERNAHKNSIDQEVTPEEAEDLFFNEPLVVRSDVRHSKREKRYYALGQTSVGRCIFAAFTIRGTLLRVISVRDMNRKERDASAKHQEDFHA
jgi:uncharacterized DUF497 family protein